MTKKAPHLALYYYMACPFCRMVDQVIKELNIKVEYRDILANSEFAQEHLKQTGRRTVPCLYIDGQPMFESRDIINWLEDNQAQLEKTTDGNS